MKSYSLDLREKILETYKAGGITQRELAARFRVSTFFVVKLLGLDRRGEPLAARKRGGRRKPISHSRNAGICQSRVRETKRSDFT